MSIGAQHADSLSEMVVKGTPPVSISLATVMGYNVSDLVIWATLLYTLLMIGHKVYHIYKEVTRKKENGDSKRTSTDED